MTTVKQIERLWVAGQFDRLLQDLCAGRPEAALQLHRRLRVIPAASAMAMIRLDELAQSHVPLYSRLIRTLLNTQEADGGWSDPMTTALCLRALLLQSGGGDAIERGLAYLANLQKDNGAWPAEPIRRLAEDVPTTAFLLYQLGDQPAFRQRVRFADALAFLAAREMSVEPDARRLCHRASARCRLAPTPRAAGQFVWS
jgi:hypothetical protein